MGQRDRIQETTRRRIGARSSWLLTTLVDPSMPAVSFLEQFDVTQAAESDGPIEPQQTADEPPPADDQSKPK